MSSLLAITKLIPFSNRIACMCPRLEITSHSASNNESVDRSLASSMWVALVFRHVNETPYRLTRPVFDLVFELLLTTYGPK